MLRVSPRDNVKRARGPAFRSTVVLTIDTELVLIGELAKRSFTTTKAIRIYEARRLVAPVMRAANRYRYFDASLVKIIPVFTKMLSIGLALRDIRAIFAPAEPIRTCPSDADLRASMVRAQPIYRRHIELIDAQMEDLVGRRQAFELRLERCRRELGASGAVKLPESIAGRRRIRPGRVEYERTPNESNGRA